MTRSAPRAVVLICSLAASRPASACKCLPPPEPCVALERSSAVFVGDLLGVEQGPWSYILTFYVTKAWKGVTTQVVTVTTNDGNEGCGYPLPSNRAQVIYASGSSPLGVSACSRSHPLQYPDEDTDILELGPPAIVFDNRPGAFLPAAEDAPVP